MDTTWLVVFREVAQQGSLTGAARTLGYTQSAVSRQISALEHALGAVLLDRLPRGVRLTDAGQAVLGHVEAVLERLRDARADVVALRELAAGRLRVGSFASANTGLIPGALAEFRAAHPKVAVSVREDRTATLLAQVRAGDLDIAVVSDHKAEPLDGTDLELREITRDPVLVALPAGHPLATRHELRLSDLAGESWITGTRQLEDTLVSGWLSEGFQPRVEYVVREWTGKLGFVAAGLGVTAVPGLAASGVRGDVALVPLHPDNAPVRTVYAATPRGISGPPSVAPFVRCLESTAGSMVFGHGNERRQGVRHDAPEPGDR